MYSVDEIRAITSMSPTALQIKVKALQRLLKEEKMYLREVTEQEAYVEQMRSSNADEYDLKKQIEVLHESQRMVPELTKKVKEHRDGLVAFLKTYTGDEDTTEAKQLL